MRVIDPKTGYDDDIVCDGCGDAITGNSGYHMIEAGFGPLDFCYGDCLEEYFDSGGASVRRYRQSIG